jgi:hypothetical protein
MAVLPTAVLEKRANAPSAVLSVAVVLLKSAPAPIAVLLLPVLLRSVPAPTPVHKLPSVRLRSEYTPNAELYKPVVTLARARCPSAVLPPGKAVSGAACAIVESTRKPIARSVVVNVPARSATAAASHTRSVSGRAALQAGMFRFFIV